MQEHAATAPAKSAQQPSQSSGTQSCPHFDPRNDEDCDTQLDTGHVSDKSAEAVNGDQLARAHLQETHTSNLTIKSCAPPQVSRLSVGQPETTADDKSTAAPAAAEKDNSNLLTDSGRAAEQGDALLDQGLSTSIGGDALCS